MNKTKIADIVIYVGAVSLVLSIVFNNMFLAWIVFASVVAYVILKYKGKQDD